MDVVTLKCDFDIFSMRSDGGDAEAEVFFQVFFEEFLQIFLGSVVELVGLFYSALSKADKFLAKFLNFVAFGDDMLVPEIERFEIAILVEMLVAEERPALEQRVSLLNSFVIALERGESVRVGLDLNVVQVLAAKSGLAGEHDEVFWAKKHCLKMADESFSFHFHIIFFERFFFFGKIDDAFFEGDVVRRALRWRDFSDHAEEIAIPFHHVFHFSGAKRLREREQIDGFEKIAFPLAVFAGQDGDICVCKIDIECIVIAEMLEMERFEEHVRFV